MMLFEELTGKMEELCKREGLNEYEYNKRKFECNEIHKALKRYYPDCQVLIYGSSTNGYGTKISDLDLLFKPYPDYMTTNLNATEEDDIDKVPNISEIDSGYIPKERLLGMGVTSQLCFVRRILRRKKCNYKMMLLIRAKCPIVNFTIRSLQISCDISCGSSHVIHNTKLLRFFSTIDKRVRPLVMTLRHWAKSLSFIQSGVMSSYAFTLLVIFFLQNTDPPVLPSVQYLNEAAGSHTEVDGWDVSFCTDISKVNKCDNTKSSGELLKKFFEFYLMFDFSNDIVSIYFGKPLSIEKIENLDERMTNFEIFPMNIQDPFILTYNVGRNSTYKLLAAFKQSLNVVLKIIEKMDQLQSKYKFELLFDKNKYEHLLKEDFNPPHSNRGVSCLIDFNPRLSKDSSELMWYKNVCQALFNLLQYGLLIDCEIVDGTAYCDTKMSDHITEDNNFELLMSIQCAVFHRTYVGRSKIKETDSTPCDNAQFENNTLKREYIISNMVIKQNPLLSSHEPYFWFYCNCYKPLKSHLKTTIVVLMPLTEYNDKKKLFNFLTSFIFKNVLKVFSDYVTSSV